MRAPVVIAIVTALSACEQPTPRYDHSRDVFAQPTTVPPVMMSTDRETYPAAAPVRVRLTNATGRTVGYNLCRASLEYNLDELPVVQRTLGEVCTMELRSLRPGQSAAYVFRTSPSARPGAHRVRAVLQTDAQGGRPLEVVSNWFYVTRDTD